MSVPLVKLNDSNSIPIIGLGTVNLTKQSIRDAINCGYRHFDSAYLYKTEKIVGDAVNEAISDGIVKREDIYFVSKVWPTDYGNGRVIRSAKRSINDSGLKYLDLLLLHWPFVLIDDDSEGLPKLPNGDIAYSDYDIVDVYKELEEVKRMGLAKSIGVSNFNCEHIERILKIAEFIPVTNQVESHPYSTKDELIKFCAQTNITVTAYSPLGSSVDLVGENKPSLFDDKTLRSIANKHNVTVAQVLIRWQTQRGVIVIPRSANKQRMQENINVFDFTLTEEDMESINSLNSNYRYIDGSDWGLAVDKSNPFIIEF